MAYNIVTKQTTPNAYHVSTFVSKPWRPVLKMIAKWTQLWQDGR